MFSGLVPNALRVLLASLLLPEGTSRNFLQFNLRHEHAVASMNHIVFANVPKSIHQWQSKHQPFITNTSSIRTYYPSSFAAYSNAIHRSVRHSQSSLLDWRDDEVQGPDVDSRETVLTLAKMTYDAYLEPSDREWYELGSDWNYVRTF
jgi:lipase ATG15